MNNDLSNATAVDAEVREIVPNVLAIPQVALVKTNPGDILHGTARAVNSHIGGVNEAIRGIARRLLDQDWSPARESAISVYAAVVAVVDRQMRDNGVHNNGGIRQALIHDFVGILDDMPAAVNAPAVAIDALHPVNALDDAVLATAPNNIISRDRVRSGQPSEHILMLRSLARDGALYVGYDGATQDVEGEGNAGVDGGVGMA